jgi:hypothetical protein
LLLLYYLFYFHVSNFNLIKIIYKILYFYILINKDCKGLSENKNKAFEIFFLGIFSKLIIIYILLLFINPGKKTKNSREKIIVRRYLYNYIK